MTENQTTLLKAVNFEGIGLHCGKPAKLTIEPAPIGYGIILESDGARIPADADFVSETARGVTLSNNGVSVKTVEHALSALRGLGVDNALLKIEGEEVPVLDGSAWLYVEAIEAAGLLQYDKAAAVWEYPQERSFVFRHKNSSYSVRSSDHLHLDVSLSFPNTAIGTQEVGFTFNGNDAYAREVAKS
ncbi:MAG: UDP-3-O-acyl-N-acetylglucosamine deacetylase, partial [Elusimicrobiota bacterium]